MPQLIPDLTRRSALAGAGLAAAGLTLSACTVYDSSGPAVPAAPDAAGTTAGAGPAGAALGKAADIPVGGGTIFPDQRLVVTQPTAGTLAAFSSTCTHQGCTVSTVADGTINCPCHGSKFHIADGSVASGPAKKPLPRQNITVVDGAIVPA